MPNRKLERSGLLLLVALALVLSLTPLARAVPTLPSSFSGTVKVNGLNVPEGTVVSAWSGGVKWRESTTVNYLSESWYLLEVPGDDPETTEVEGLTEGATVTFKVGDLDAAQTGTWHAGSDVTLNLTANGALQTPTPTTTASTPATATPTPSPTIEGQTTTVTLEGGCNGYSGIQDIYLHALKPTTNMWGGDLQVRRSERNALVRFDLTGVVPENAVVTDAQLKLYSYYPYPFTGQQRIDAYGIRRPWVEREATWNQASAGVPWAQAGCNDPTTDRDPTPVDSALVTATRTRAVWHITSLVQRWIETPDQNYGVVLVGQSPDTVYMISADMGSGCTHQHPMLVISYVIRPPTATPTNTPTPSTTPTPTATIASTKGIIRGVVWVDANGNGQQDAGEKPYEGARVHLNRSNFQYLGMSITGADGSYDFGLQQAGDTYKVTIEIDQMAGYEVTYPQQPYWLFALAGGTVTTKNFGVRLVPTATPTATRTPTITTTPSPTTTSTVSRTPTPTITYTPTPGPSPTVTRTPSISPTPSATKPTTPTPTNTPGTTPTPTWWIDTQHAIQAACGGTYQGTTVGKANNASSHSCEIWEEAGPEAVYRLTLVQAVPELVVELVEGGMVPNDLDLFLYPESAAQGSCLDSGNVTMSLSNVPAGTYYVVVDGFGAAAGPYILRIDCGDDYPTPTPTTPPPTATPTATREHEGRFLPQIARGVPLPTWTPVATATPTPTPYEVRVNCGGPNYTDHLGTVWLADKAFSTGSWGYTGSNPAPYHSETPIADTEDDGLYQYQQSNMGSYRFAVPNGTYRVELHFAEIVSSCKIGYRMFDVAVQGNTVLEYFDQIARNLRNRADVETVEDVHVTNGLLEITFTKRSLDYAPSINGIRVTQTGY